jgi:CheY-like chemotaxis protein
MANARSAPSVLLVEDNAADIGLFEIALEHCGFQLHLRTSPNGWHALEELRHGSSDDAGGFPSLVLTDLNMPRLSGREFLTAIRKDAALRCVPVVILSSSSARRDIDDCLALGANAYVVKPIDFEEFSAKLKKTLEFFLHICARPPAAAAPLSSKAREERNVSAADASGGRDPSRG